MKKKTLIILILATLLVVSGVAGISAYLTASDNAENSFVIGGCNVEVVEDFVPPPEIDPGTEFTKDVQVKNLGPSECYVRVKAVFTDSDMGDNCTVDWNTSDFEYNDEDGYYYYKDKLEVGESTESLLTNVKVSDSISDSEIKDFDILIYTEAYQSDGFSDYEEAWLHYSRNKPVRPH